MSRRKIQRTEDEEEQFQRKKRERNATWQRMNRAKNQNQNIHNISNTQTNNNIIVDLPIEFNEEILPNSVNLQIPVTNLERHNLPQQITRKTRLHFRDILSKDIKEHYIGLMDVASSHCDAMHFANEKVANKKNSFNDCCSHREVVLKQLPEPPEILRDLFNGTHEKSSHFHERIRCYNNSFAFESFNANSVQFNNNRRPGPCCSKIQGQIYYQINTSLYPSPDKNPSYGQLFIVDQNESVDIRCNQSSSLDKEIVLAIDNALRQCNVFSQSYRMIHEEIQQSMINSQSQTEPEMQLLLTLKPGMDKRRYNSQRINEVAAIFSTTADGDIPDSYVTIHNKRTKSLQYVSSMDPIVEPMIYPLYHSHGTQGWSDNIRCVTRDRRVTRTAFIKHRMAIRKNNMFLMGGPLFQQWIVGNYVKIGKDRMNYCRLNQKTLRVDTYQGLVDHLQHRANETVRAK